MTKYEQALYQKGYKLIAGIDEVGRGCIAGPLVCAIVILPKNYNNHLIKDSKQLTANQREILYEQILKVAIAYHVEVINAVDVDELNPKQASISAMQNCVKNINITPDYLLIDYEKIKTNIPFTSITKGDTKSISIAAASIIAKVYRDHLMDKMHIQYPNYDFKNNKGYLTKKHLHALKTYGPIKKIHRFSYQPIKQD